MNTEAEPESLGHWSLDPRTLELESSGVCRRNHGRQPHEDPTYEQILASIHPDDRERVREALRRAQEEGEDYEAEYRCVWLSGEVRWIRAHGRLLQSSNGGGKRLVGTTLDITADKAGRGEPERTASPARREQAILEAAGEGIYGLDASGRVTFVNPAARRMVGRSSGELLGKRMHDEIHHSRPDGSPYPARECPIYDTLRYGVVHHAEDEVFWRADGTSFPAQYTATPIVEDGEVAGAVVTFSEITKRKLDEERQAYLLKLSDALRMLGDPIEIQAVALRVLGEHLEADRVFYAEINEERDEYVINRNYADGVPLLIGHFRLGEIPHAAEMAGTGKTVVVDEANGDPRLSEAERAAYAKMNVAAAVGVPLIKDGNWVVGLGVQQATPRNWTPEEISLIHETAERTWAAAERARAEERVRDREERLHLATEAAELGIWEIDLHTNASPVRSERHDKIFGYEEPVESWSFEIFLEHVHPEDRERIQNSFDAALQTGVWEFECRIIRADGEERWITAQGKFYFERGGPRRAVGAIRDITERKRAEEEREQARRRRAFLVEASRRLSESLDYEQTLSEIARLAVPRICDLCIVDALAAPGDGESVRRLAAAHHDPEKERLAWELERRYPVSKDERSAVAEVIRTGKPALVSEVSEQWLQYMAQDEGQLEILKGLDLGSIVIVPLTTHRRTLGALTLASDGSGRRYDEEALYLAQDLARRAAQSMDNARLYAEQSYTARTLQQSLLPPSLPEIPGIRAAARFRPATSYGGAATGGYNVGGDFYDVFQTPAGWAVVVGDVMGKGVEAAELTAMVRYTLRTAAMTGEPPSSVVATLNAAMLGQRSDLRFCTLAYGLLNESRDGAARLALCRGGHPAPLILRADGTVEEAGARGLLVGVEPDTRWSDAFVELAAGDSLVFYTDGLTEARNPEGRMFGEQRLKDLAASCCSLGAEETASALENGVLEFLEGGNPRDDVALLVIRATGRDEPV